MAELCEVSGRPWTTTRRTLDSMKKAPIIYTGSKLYFEMSDEDLEIIRTTNGTEEGRQEFKEKKRLSLQSFMKERVPRNLIDKQNSWLITWGITQPVISSKESYSNSGFMSHE